MPGPASGRATRLALVALVVLAGCGSALDGGSTATDAPATGTAPPTPTSTPTPTAAGTPTATVAVRNGTLPVNATRLFVRLRAFLGVNTSPPRYVRVVDDPGALAPGTTGEVPRFWRLVGVEPGGLEGGARDRLENGVTTGLGGIIIYPGRDPSPARVRWVLVHEYVHYVQLRKGWSSTLARRVPAGTTDGRYVVRAIVEGTAVYATDAYLARHRPGAEPTVETYRDLRARLAPGSLERYANGAYLAGRRYVAARLDSPRAIGRVFRRPPTTSEQVLHPGAPGGIPANLTVRIETGAEWRYVGADRMGEAFVRAALANGIATRRATRAAAGWGNDSLRIFRAPGRNASYAWVLRWDDAANASEFERLLRGYLDARGTRVEDGWRLDGVTADIRAPGDRTTVLALGNRSFVRELRVDAAGRRVTIVVGDARAG